MDYKEQNNAYNKEIIKCNNNCKNKTTRTTSRQLNKYIQTISAFKEYYTIFAKSTLQLKNISILFKNAVNNQSTRHNKNM